MFDRETLRTLKHPLFHRPAYFVGLVVLSTVAAVLEAVGIGFILPIVSIASDTTASGGGGRLLSAFVAVYRGIGVELTLRTAIAGLTIVMFVRYSTSFLVDWRRAALVADYEQTLKREAFWQTLHTETEYIDQQGTDTMLNAVLTQTTAGANVIGRIVDVVKISLICLMYLSIALYLAPILALGSLLALGSITAVVRYVVEPASDMGNRVADANEDAQAAVQAGILGIREVKLTNTADTIFDRLIDTLSDYVDAKVTLHRNQAALSNAYQFASAVVVFALVFFALRYASLSLSALGVFLFAMFRLAPMVSSLNDQIYDIQGKLPHVSRTLSVFEELNNRQEPDDGTQPVPERISTVEFEDVSFGYGDDRVLDSVSLAVSRGEFVGVVGESGAGKSTVVSLLARLYEPDDGTIRADGTPITEFPIDEWRQHVAVVRQDPYLFNTTLRKNLSLAAPEATKMDIERVCDIAQVTEFLDDLPHGYDTELGTDGIRLSGGQKQRVALARALLQDADLLVLDEATSDLDSNIERRVQQGIEDMDRDIALVTVAHRLSTLRNADRILTVDDGDIVESGSHEELIEQNGLYADMYAKQSAASESA